MAYIGPLSLISLLLLLPLSTGTIPRPTLFITAPNVFRIGVQETVVVNVLNVDDAVDVTIYLQDRSNGSPHVYAQTTVVGVEPDKPQKVLIGLRFDDIPSLTLESQYAYLFVESTSSQFDIPFREGKEVLVTYNSTFVFIQVDKPVYNPQQTVNMHIIPVGLDLKPSTEPIRIDIINPKGTIMEREEGNITDTGLIRKKFRFPTLPVFGKWSVIVYYGPMYRFKTKAHFTVKEHVLPKFSVKVTAPQYILSNTDTIPVNIDAKYSYGKTVDGRVNLRIGIQRIDKTILKIHREIDFGELTNTGHAIQVLDLNEIFETKWFDLYVGNSIYLEARVVEGSTGIMEKVSTTSPIVEKAYIFQVDKTLRFFKRGLPFEVKANVLDPSGTPVREGIHVIARGEAILSNGAQVKLSGENDSVRHHRTNAHGQITFVYSMPLDAEEIIVNLTTNDKHLKEKSQNGEILFEAHPYESPNENYMLIRVLREDVNKVRVAVGSELQAQVILSDSSVERIIHYIVIARNKVIAENTVESMVDEAVYFPIFVTNDLVPLVRIVAFYIDENQEVVADSVLLEVENVCENTVSISVIDSSTNKADSFKPNKNITFLVDGKPSTRVGLIAVDKSVYNLENYERLSKEKLFKKMQGFDLGCGPGGGSSSEDVFLRAGITVITNANINVQRREELACPVAPSRRRRSIYDNEMDIELVEMCTKGRQKAGSKSCDDAASKIADKKELALNDPLVRRFYNCCVEESSHKNLVATRQSTATADIDDFELRTHFPETWMFQEIEIGESGFEELTLSTPSSITTWFVQGTGISNDIALCVADPLEVTVFQPFFMKLDLPYSVIRGEHIHIQAVLYNYVEEDFEVDVFMYGVKGVCSAASTGEMTASQALTLKGNDQATVSFILMPLESGIFPITVAAIAKGDNREERDAVVSNLRVIPEGLHHASVLSLILDPSNTRKSSPYEEDSVFKHNHVESYGKYPQTDIVTIRLPDDVVKGSDALTLKIAGDPVGPTLTSIAEGLEGALELPTVCGEQTLIQFAPHIHALSYLNTTGQLTLPIYNQAQRVLKEGYDREMAFFQGDGSYKEWQDSDYSSTWLTAFATRTMCEANQFIFIDNQVIAQSIHWLMNHQGSDGHFNETYAARDAVDGLNGQAALTAHVLTTLLQCRHHVEFSVHHSIIKATDYLERVLTRKSVENEYALAIMTYALALAKSKLKLQANTKLLSLATYDEDLGYRYWNVEETTLDTEDIAQCWRSFKPSSISVKTTGYALLAQLQLGNMEISSEIVEWLVRQQRHLSIGSQSTTCICAVSNDPMACITRQQFVQNLHSCDVQVGMQALAEYAKKTHASSSLNLNVKVVNMAKADSTVLQLRKNNALVQQQLEIVGPFEGPIVIETNGTGSANLQMELTFNTKPNVNIDTCMFSVVASTTEVKNSKANGRNLRYHVQACTRNLQDKRVSMGVLEIQLFSGFTFIKETLRKDDVFKQFEEANRSVLFYLEEIPRDAPACVNFDIEQLFTVVSIQPVTVSIYDYAEPDNKCTEFYQPPGGSELLGLLCLNETACQCSTDKCVSFSSETSLENLIEQACSSDYVYEISVKRVEETEFFYKYTGNIISLTQNTADNVNKESTISKVKRSFWLSKGCRHVMKKSRKYLIMGPNSIVHSSKDGKTEYLLDGKAHIELVARRESLKSSNFKRHLSEC